MNKFLTSFVVLLVATLLVAPAAIAQPGGGGPDNMRFRGGFGQGFGAGNMGLLANERVQEELGLVEDQIAELQAIQQLAGEAMRSMFSEMQDLDREDRRAFMEGMREKIQEKMKGFEEDANKVLLPHQKDRLKQLGFQMSGRGQGAGGALGNESLLEELGVTDEQREKIEEATQKAREDLRAKYQELVREAEEEILSSLTREQREKYKQMIGEPFEFTNPDGSWGRGRGGQEGPGGGRRGGGGGDRSDF